ncbi:MAG TPA: hypothetical protein VH107_13865 [Lacipirellulaceae bacterium]|nr:hypothetical protein [Lacipirellulaceae bacterium]
MAARRQEGYQALVVKFGQPPQQTLARIGQEDVIVEISVQWVDQKRRALRVIATANGPSCWNLQRLDESILIESDGY